MVLRGHGAQPRHLVQPAVQRPAEPPRRRQPHGERDGARPRCPAGAADPARRPDGDLRRRPGARPRPDGRCLVLAVPPAAAGAPRRGVRRRRVRRVRARPGLARQRAPQLRRPVPRARHPRPGAPARRGAASGPRRRGPRPARRVAGVHRGGGAAPRGDRHARGGPGAAGARTGRPAPAAAGRRGRGARRARDRRVPAVVAVLGAAELRVASGTRPPATTSPSCGPAPPARWVPTRGPRRSCR